MRSIEKIKSYISPIIAHEQMIQRHNEEKMQLEKKYGTLIHLQEKLVEDVEEIYNPKRYVDNDTWRYTIRFDEIVDSDIIKNYISAKHALGQLPPTKKGYVYLFIDNSGETPINFVSSQYSVMRNCTSIGIIY